MSSAYDRGAHDYRGTTNSRSQRSLTKMRRGLSRRDLVMIRRLEALIQQGRRGPDDR